MTNKPEFKSLNNIAKGFCKLSKAFDNMLVEDTSTNKIIDNKSNVYHEKMASRYYKNKQ